MVSYNNTPYRWGGAAFLITPQNKLQLLFTFDCAKSACLFYKVNFETLDRAEK